LSDDEELDSFLGWPAQDGSTQEAGNLPDGRKSLVPQMLNIDPSMLRLRQAAPLAGRSSRAPISTRE
jgi:hypothetical protein